MSLRHRPLRHPKPNPTGNTPEEVWECGSCGGVHGVEATARGCCAPEPWRRWRCPVCEAVHRHSFEAAHCCDKAID